MEKLEKYIELKETIETFLKKEKIYMNQSKFHYWIIYAY